MPTLNASAPAFVPSEQPIVVEPTVDATQREHVSRQPSCIYQLSLGTHSTGRVFGTPLMQQCIQTQY